MKPSVLILTFLLAVFFLSGGTAQSAAFQDSSSGVTGAVIFGPRAWRGDLTSEECDLIVPWMAARTAIGWSNRCASQLVAQNSEFISGTYFTAYSETLPITNGTGTLSTSGTAVTLSGNFDIAAGDFIKVLTGGSYYMRRVAAGSGGGATFTLDGPFASNISSASTWHRCRPRAYNPGGGVWDRVATYPELVLYTAANHYQPVDFFIASANCTLILNHTDSGFRASKLSQFGAVAVAALDNASIGAQGAGGTWSNGSAATGTWVPFTWLGSGVTGAECNAGSCDPVWSDSVIAYFKHLKDNFAGLIWTNSDIKFLTESQGTTIDSTRIAALAAAVDVFLDEVPIINPLYADREEDLPKATNAKRYSWYKAMKTYEAMQNAGVAVIYNIHPYVNCIGTVDTSDGQNDALDCSNDIEGRERTFDLLSVATNQLTVAGDQRQYFAGGDMVLISGSSIGGNNGRKIADYAYYNGTNTVIPLYVGDGITGTSSGGGGTVQTNIYGHTADAYHPPHFVRWALASYLLVNKATSYIYQPIRGGRGTFEAGNPYPYWFVDKWFPEAAAVRASMGTACEGSVMTRQGGGAGDARDEAGIWTREFTGGFVAANASRTATTSVSLPSGAWTYKDLYDTTVSSLSLTPIRAQILLKVGATGCSGGASNLTLSIQSSPVGVTTSSVTADVNSATNGTTNFTRTYAESAAVAVAWPATATISGASHDFSALSGCDDVSGTGNRTCNVTMSTSRTITATYIQPTAPVLTASPSTVSPIGTVTASWATIANPTPRDWLGVYIQGAELRLFEQWQYVSCSQTPGSAVAAGSCPFVLNSLPEGTYVLRLLADDGFSLLDESDTFAVEQSSTGPVGFNNMGMRNVGIGGGM